MKKGNLSDFYKISGFAFLTMLVLTGYSAGSYAAENQQLKYAKKVEATILSSNLADGDTIGGWGFSALVEADSMRILFDVGYHPDTVAKNHKSKNQ